ncbi:MAG TPA: alpha/beta-type small acid-soluble spore protein [Firmicutes bacterium]|nr:alpha/beta-type small acid-soluble spore protein [Bacillota bacterium]
MHLPHPQHAKEREVNSLAAGQSRNTPVIPQAGLALERFKQEVAAELGIPNYQGYLGDLPSRINGAVGGHMVRRMIAAAEQSLISQASAQVSAQFKSALGSQVGTGMSGTSTQSFGTGQSGTANWANPSHT